MSAADRVLDRLQKARQTGAGRWLAPCPAHEDKSPSLSVRELDDGRVLIHCFAGCGSIDVLEALGLKWGDLFDKPLERCLPPIRAALNSRELIEVTAHEVTVAVLLVHYATERELTPDESDRLMLAAARLGKAQAMINAR